jgi:hypothetical protein
MRLSSISHTLPVLALCQKVHVSTLILPQQSQVIRPYHFRNSSFAWLVS